MSELVPIGALWESTDKEGNRYLSGKMGDARLLIFKNKFKEKDNQPDYRVYVTTPQKRDSSSDGFGDSPDDQDVPF